jgi:hypothetical protein
MAIVVLATTAVASLSAVTGSIGFSGSIGLGSILVAMFVTILAGSVSLRSRLLKDQIDGWKGNYEQAKERISQLEADMAHLTAELNAAKIVIQRLEQLPNLERVVRLMSDTQQKQQEFVMELHREGMAAHATTLAAIGKNHP